MTSKRYFVVTWKANKQVGKRRTDYRWLADLAVWFAWRHPKCKAVMLMDRLTNYTTYYSKDG